jgi:hypothetical protein
VIIPDHGLVPPRRDDKRDRCLQLQNGLPALTFHNSRFGRSIHRRFD